LTANETVGVTENVVPDVVELPVPACVILRATSGPYVQSRLRVRAVIWNVSPAVTEADEDSEPAHRQLPAVEASHSEKWL